MIYIAFDSNGNAIGFGDDPAIFDRALPAPEGFDPETDLPLARLENGKVVLTPLTPPPPPRVLTHFGFRQLLTLAEQVIMDNFTDPEFVTAHPVLKQLNVMQRATLKTAVRAYETAAEINLDEPAVQQFVGLLAQMGLLDAPKRAAVILAGEAPSV